MRSHRARPRLTATTCCPLSLLRLIQRRRIGVRARLGTLLSRIHLGVVVWGLRVVVVSLLLLRSWRGRSLFLGVS